MRLPVGTLVGTLLPPRASPRRTGSVPSRRGTLVGTLLSQVGTLPLKRSVPTRTPYLSQKLIWGTPGTVFCRHPMMKKVSTKTKVSRYDGAYRGARQAAPVQACRVRYFPEAHEEGRRRQARRQAHGSSF